MKKGLGRGLESLFSIYEDEEETQSVQKEQSGKIVDNFSIKAEVRHGGVEELDIKVVDPSMNQPRKYFEPNALKELSESIKRHGVIQPIIVNQEKNGRFTIIAGERRFRASLIAGKKTIPAIVKNYSPMEVKEVALIENLQREDLNPIEAAKAIKQLMNEFSFTQDEVADKIGKSRPLVANTLRLLYLSSPVIELIEKNKLSAGHGKCLVVVEDVTKQLEFANLVIDNKLSVRDLEKIIKDYQTPKQSNFSKKIEQSFELKNFCKQIQEVFKTKVQINGDDKKGKIVINYFNKDDLDRFYSIINSLKQ